MKERDLPMVRFSLRLGVLCGIVAGVVSLSSVGPSAAAAEADQGWEQGFRNPPPGYRPEVFWDWMGGLLSREGITKDLESLSRAGVGGVLVMQMPDQLAGVVQVRFRDYPGKVKCLSDEWFALANHAAKEADRLGLRLSFLMCPGWSHCGGPWIKPEKGLKILVAERKDIEGPSRFDNVLPRAPIHKPSGDDTTLSSGDDAAFWERVKNPREDFYRDVAVIAVPLGSRGGPVPLEKIVDLTKRMDAQGRLVWDVPTGKWTVLRLGVASENGPNHPTTTEGTGLECDRMDPAAVRVVYDGMIARIVKEARAKGYKSVQRFETDSYEGGRQDFGLDFQTEFGKRRGYDCTPWLPAWLDQKLVIGSGDLTLRFRTDMLRTISELWIERFYGELRRLAEENNLEWMIEPYFASNHDWRTAGARAHVSGCEFWMGGPQLIGPAPDIAALYGHKVVWAESFTSESYESAWRNDPWRMKLYGDAAYCQGINHFIMHGFTHNPFGDRYQPGLSFGFWGTQMNRHLTWWPYSSGWHRYLARCEFLLQQGLPVADVLTYPPKVEHIPGPVLDTGDYRQTVVNDEALLERLAVREGRIVLPHGTSYAALALVPGQALRPEALRKIRDLVNDGATLIGTRPPDRSASLENFPACDREIVRLNDDLWRPTGAPRDTKRKGRVITVGTAAQALGSITGGPDFICRPFHIPAFAQEAIVTPRVSYFHRRANETDIYFVSNQEDRAWEILGEFRVIGKQPELWNPVTGDVRPLTDFRPVWVRKATWVPLQLAPRQSVFVVFRKPSGNQASVPEPNFPAVHQVLQLDGIWDVSFDPKWGGPEHVTFDALTDWTQRAEPGIRYYSGAAIYRKQFDLPEGSTKGVQLNLDLGIVSNLARVRLNDRDLGVVWCAPWHVQVTDAVKPKGNRLEITVVNTWVNRLIGDEQEPEDSQLFSWDPDQFLDAAARKQAKDHWGFPSRRGGYAVDVFGRGLKDLPDWMICGEPRPSSHRYTFSSWRYYPKEAPLRQSGLLGPVTVQKNRKSAE